MNSNVKLTLKLWPAIALATILLCFLTKTIAGLFGIDLPDQQNVDIVRQWGLHAFDSLKNFLGFARIVAVVILVMPALEELIFRALLYKLPSHFAPKAHRLFALLSSALFMGAHYIVQPFPDAAFIALFFFGMAQCWLYRKTNRVSCVALNHALFNLTNLVLLFILSPFSS